MIKVVQRENTDIEMPGQTITINGAHTAALIPLSLSRPDIGELLTACQETMHLINKAQYWFLCKTVHGIEDQQANWHLIRLFWLLKCRKGWILPALVISPVADFSQVESKDNLTTLIVNKNNAVQMVSEVKRNDKRSHRSCKVDSVKCFLFQEKAIRCDPIWFRNKQWLSNYFNWPFTRTKSNMIQKGQELKKMTPIRIDHSQDTGIEETKCNPLQVSPTCVPTVFYRKQRVSEKSAH